MGRCETCIFSFKSNSEKEFKKNEIIFHEGENVDAIYLINNGLVKLEKIQEDGEIRLIDVVRDGDYLALLTILNEDSVYKVTATALTDISVTPITKADANDAYHNNMHFKETCLLCASNRLGAFQWHTFNVGSIDAKQKILSTLEHFSTKFGVSKDGYTYIKLPINKTELANMCGLRRETLSRKLKAMKDAGLIDFKKNVYRI